MVFKHTFIFGFMGFVHVKRMIYVLNISKKIIDSNHSEVKCDTYYIVLQSLKFTVDGPVQ